MSDKEKENDDLVFSVGDIVSGYKIVEKIDEGGFGQVFKVTKDDKIYAMKIESNQQEGGSAIKLEIDVLMDLKARKVPNFPQVIQAGKKVKYHFLVMELLGDNLKSLRFRSSNPESLSAGTWTRLGIQCLYVVKLLHDNGFVHRDIKPSNFAMGYADDALKGRLVYLFDFGLARRFVLKMKVEESKRAKKEIKKEPSICESNREPKKNITEDKERQSTREKGGKKFEKAMTGKNQIKKVMQRVKGSTKRKKKDVSCYEGFESSDKEKKSVPAPESVPYKFRLARPHTDFRGTQQYASPNAHSLIELGRADDVWSLMYMLAEMTNPLPWSTNEDIAIEDQKNQSSLQLLFRNPVFQKIDESLKSCNYYSAPDYELCYQTMKAIMDKSGVGWNDPYDWETETLASFVKWKEEKTKNKIVYGWEDPKDYFKKDAWASLEKPTPPAKKDKDKEKEKDKDMKEKKSGLGTEAESLGKTEMKTAGTKTEPDQKEGSREKDKKEKPEKSGGEEIIKRVGAEKSVIDLDERRTPSTAPTPTQLTPPAAPTPEKRRTSAETCEAPTQYNNVKNGRSTYGAVPVDGKKSARKKVAKKNGSTRKNAKSVVSKAGTPALSNRMKSKFTKTPQ